MARLRQKKSMEMREDNEKEGEKEKVGILWNERFSAECYILK